MLHLNSITPLFPSKDVFTLSTKEQGYEIDYLRHHAGSQTVSAVVLVSCYVVMVIASKLGGSQSSVFYHHIIIFAIMILLVVTAYFVNHPYRKRILIESKLLNSSGRALPNSTNISGGIFNRATENKYLVANTGVADFTKLNSSGEAVSAAAAAVTSSASMPTNLNGVWVEEAYLDIPERFLWFTPNLVAVLLIWLALFGLLLDYCIDFNTNFTIYRLMFNIVELHLLFVGLKMYYMNGSLLVCIAALVATFVSIGQGDSNSYALLNRYQLFIIFSMYAVLVILNNYRIDRVSRLNYFMKIENDKGKLGLEKRLDEVTNLIIFVLSSHVVFEQTRAAKQGTESLLLNILPLKAVQKLKEDPTHQIADEKPDVAIMFVSICSFEKLHKLNAIWNLNDIICDFDECCPLFGVEKIKTIGTRYMVMCEPNDISAGGGGVDSTTSSLATSEHIIRLINFSLKLQEVINDFNKRTNNAFTLRAGISAGPVAAGVIGTKTFTYDVWGDVVNVASRMESTGIEGHLQLTETVYHRINNGAGVVGKFRFLSRGAVFVKGKGDMSTHLLDIQSPNGGGGAVGSGHIIRKSSLKHMDSSKRLSVSFPQGSCGGGSIGGERERRPSEQQRRPSLLKQAIEKNAMESESRCASILQPSEFPPSLFAQVSGSGAVGYIMTSAEMSIGSRRSSSAAVAVGGSMFAGGIREATGISLGNISEQAGSSMQSENSVEQQPQEAEEEKRVSLGRPASRKGSFSLGRSPVMRPSVLRELARADTEAAEDGHAYKSKIQENEEEDVEKVMKEEEEEDEKPVRFSKVRSSSYSSTSNSPPKRPSTWYAGRPSIAEDVS